MTVQCCCRTVQVCGLLSITVTFIFIVAILYSHHVNIKYNAINRKQKIKVNHVKVIIKVLFSINIILFLWKRHFGDMST